MDARRNSPRASAFASFLAVVAFVLFVVALASPVDDVPWVRARFSSRTPYLQYFLDRVQEDLARQMARIADGSISKDEGMAQTAGDEFVRQQLVSRIQNGEYGRANLFQLCLWPQDVKSYPTAVQDTRPACRTLSAWNDQYMPGGMWAVFEWITLRVNGGARTAAVALACIAVICSALFAVAAGYVWILLRRASNAVEDPAPEGGLAGTARTAVLAARALGAMSGAAGLGAVVAYDQLIVHISLFRGDHSFAAGFALFVAGTVLSAVAACVMLCAYSVARAPRKMPSAGGQGSPIHGESVRLDVPTKKESTREMTRAEIYMDSDEVERAVANAHNADKKKSTAFGSLRFARTQPWGSSSAEPLNIYIQQ